MSIEIIEHQIGRFLASEAPEVMSIKGAWGVGKTYAWNKYLGQAKNKKKIAFNRYSYVSLFGIDSLKDLKFAIFENLVEINALNKKPSVESFKGNVSGLLKKMEKRSFPLVSSGESSGHYHAMLDSLSFLSLEKTIICIDDFERKGRNIEAQDILGLITQLKEQKKCKVALILNDESLAEDSSIDYIKLREKVIDTELRFAPSAEDCIRIALNSDRISSLLAENIVRLKINNIRIIKKIEKLAGLLAPLLKEFDSQVLDRALHTLTLLTWCYYSRSSEVPEYNFVIGRYSAFTDLDEELTLTTQQQGWGAILRNYDNFSIDEFDQQIASLIQNGYVDERRLLEEAAVLNDKILAARSEHSFQEAWRKFNESFDDNAQEVIDCLSSSFQNNAKYINPVNLDGTVRLLRHLGKDKLATKIIDLYIKKRSDEVELFNLDSEPALGEIRDQEIVTKFREKFTSLRGKTSLSEIFARMLRSDHPADEDEIQLAEASVDEYVELFKAQKGQSLSQYVDLCLEFSRLGGTTDHQKQIADKATEALQVIGRESRLNASRVRRFGIKV